MTEIEEIRVGRNFIRKGDVVRVTPSSPGKRDGGLATLQKITEHPEAGLEFHVVLKAKQRVFRANRIKRVAQVRGGEKRKAR